MQHLTYQQVLERNLRVMDAAAISLCRENHIDIRVYDMTEDDSIRRAALGEPMGTLITSAR